MDETCLCVSLAVLVYLENKGHIVSCKYLMCTIWQALAYVYSNPGKPNQLKTQHWATCFLCLCPWPLATQASHLLSKQHLHLLRMSEGITWCSLFLSFVIHNQSMVKWGCFPYTPEHSTWEFRVWLSGWRGRVVCRLSAESSAVLLLWVTCFPNMNVALVWMCLPVFR